MSSAVFIKRYSDPARGDATRTHLRWLTHLRSGVPLPHLYPGGSEEVAFEHLQGRSAQVSDLPDLGGALGRLHGTAYARQLHAAHLDQPFATSPTFTIPDFHTGRRRPIEQLGIATDGLPAAIYKDANIRNFIITESGPALVDFDDLTLAPFGYDLAKLVVSTAMTFGHLHTGNVEAALDAYNRRVETTGGPARSCTPEQLAWYAEMHHHLTARYLHSNGYQYRWPDIRPWPSPVSLHNRR